MPTFEYSATASDGQTTRGRVFGTSMDQVMNDLRNRGLEVLQIGVATSLDDPLAGQSRPVEVSATAPRGEVATDAGERIGVAPPWEPRSYFAANVWGPTLGKVPLHRLLFFFRQFATMAGAGVPIVQSLTTLSNQAQAPKLAAIIIEMKENVIAGRKPSVAMQRYPEVFTPVIISIIRSGEEAGFTDEAYGLAADYLEREIELRNLYKRVTFWPKLEIAASVLIIVVTNMILDSIGGGEKLHSPLTTVATWIWLGPLIVGLFLFVRVGLANPRIKYNWDQFIVKIPGFGNIIRELAMAKFGRAFGAMYKAGMPMTKALMLSADACGNEYLRAQMYPAYRELERGGNMTDTLRGTGAFSPIVLDMIHTGEATGNLDQMLGKMADFYEGEANTKSTQVGLIFGVVVFLCVAIYIGMIIISFWTSHYAGVSGAGG